MKYLDIEQLERLNSFLNRIDFGDHIIYGRLNCYSLKMVQNDKKLVKHLQREFSNENIINHKLNQNVKISSVELTQSIQDIVQCSIGNLHEFSTVRLISYFISALNNTYPNYDFTDTSPNDFHAALPIHVYKTINEQFLSIVEIANFWAVINAVMALADCQFYTFLPSEDVLQSLRNMHCLWNIDIFVVNAKQKQLLYLSLFSSSSKNDNSLQLYSWNALYYNNHNHDNDNDNDHGGNDVNHHHHNIELDIDIGIDLNQNNAAAMPIVNNCCSSIMETTTIAQIMDMHERETQTQTQAQTETGTTLAVTTTDEMMDIETEAQTQTQTGHGMMAVLSATEMSPPHHQQHQHQHEQQQRQQHQKLLQSLPALEKDL